MPRIVENPSFEEVESRVLGMVQNEIILKPALSAETVAEFLLGDVGAGRIQDGQHLFTELADSLLRQYLIRAIVRERRNAKPKVERPPLFPDLELPVPQRIATPEGKHPLLAKSTATEIRAYVKTLNNRHRDRIAGLQAVLELMAPYITNNRGITAAEVAERESKGITAA